ncbi:MAG: hypothetical protein K0R29_2948 [Pseudobdellovibrio sp.]|nr:hypothetical protein [Pseudobdellovibrio sp.]
MKPKKKVAGFATSTLTSEGKERVRAESTERFEKLDALRGFAIVWMTVFHFCFDLNYFGYLNQNFYVDSFWTVQRACIVSLFLFCAGSGQAVAYMRGLSWERFFKRWREVAFGAVLVTVGSYIVYPNSFIYFGILHGIAVMLLILRLLAGRTLLLALAGVVLIALYWVAPVVHEANPQLQFLDGRLFNWIGFIGKKPITEDYVPLIPWLGVLFIGFVAGQWILKNRPQWFGGELRSNLRPLAVLGQWSLSYYLVHQPVLFGLVYLLKQVTG